MRQIPASILARTLAHHTAIGSQPGEVWGRKLSENPGQTLAETMSDEELKDYIMKSVTSVRECYQLALQGDAIAIKTLRIILAMLAPDIEYLKKIRRLPVELADLDPEKDFSLPGTK